MLELVTGSLWHCAHVIRAGSFSKLKTIMFNRKHKGGNGNRLLIIEHGNSSDNKQADVGNRFVEALSKMIALIRAGAAHAGFGRLRRSA